METEMTTDARPIPVERLTRLWPTVNPSSWRWVSAQRLTGATPTGVALVAIAPPWTGTEDMVGQLLPTHDPQQHEQVWLWLLAHLADRAQRRAGCATGRPTTGETDQCTWCGAATADHDEPDPGRMRAAGIPGW